MASNNIINDNSIGARRPKRTTKLSQRAEDIVKAGGSVLGLHSPVHNSPGIDSNVQFKPFDPLSDDITEDKEMTAPSKAPSKAPNRKLLPHTKWFGRSKFVSSEDFAPEKFEIYRWDYPRPTNFFNLSESRKAWKQRIDEQEAANDIDDGSDDWDEFSGDENHYVVGRAFVNRAKRAFRAGNTWDEFEVHERIINSEDHIAYWASLEERLNNQFRLAVLDALKCRLREEIWLEPYKDPSGLVRLPMPKKDSRMPSVDEASGRLFDDSKGRPWMAPTAEEAKRGIKGWNPNREGVWEPYYEDEDEAPNGMAEFMQDMREQAREEAQGN